MILLIGSILVAIVIGFAFRIITSRNSYEYTISRNELVVGIIISAVILMPLTVYVGQELAWRNLVTFEEYRNGWELSVVKQDVTCYKNGSCSWTYSCDPHPVTYSCNCQANKGCQTCVRIEYDNCPYVNKESHYLVRTTLGDYTIAHNRFPDDPQANRWRQSESIPQSTISSAGVGAPSYWLKVKERVDAKTPGPVTKKYDYENYILASDQTILKEYAQEVESFTKAGLLPDIHGSIINFYSSEKIYSVGTNLSNSGAWNDKLEKLNAAFGSELQGDLHLVIVNKPIDNPDEYAYSLRAYWQNKLKFGVNTLPKNSVVLILGTNGSSVTWARGFTGMPIGNEELLNSFLHDLDGLPLNPDAILGNTQSILSGNSVRTTKGQGKLESLLWGIEKPSTAFKRVSMVSKVNKDSKASTGVGYEYLKNEIQPTTTQEVLILIVAAFIAAALWGGFMILDDYFLDNFFKQYGITDFLSGCQSKLISVKDDWMEKLRNFRNGRNEGL